MCIRDSLEGGDYDIARSVDAQIPFFACKNVLYSKNCQRDIQKYLYCKEFGVSPYEGHHGQHPSKWIEKTFIIKKALAKRENAQLEKAKNNGSSK